MGIIDEWVADTGEDFWDWATGSNGNGSSKSQAQKRQEWRETMAGKICRNRWDYETYRMELERMIDTLGDYGMPLGFADPSPEEYERLVELGACGSAVGLGPMVPAPPIPPPSPWTQLPQQPQNGAMMRGNMGMLLGIAALLGGGALVGYLLRGGRKKRRR